MPPRRSKPPSRSGSRSTSRSGRGKGKKPSPRSSLPLYLLLGAVVALAVAFAVVRSQDPEDGSGGEAAAQQEQQEEAAAGGDEAAGAEHGSGGERKAGADEPETDAAASQPEAGQPPEGSPPLVPQPAPGGDGARIALVIDDLGRSIAELERLDALGVPLTYAVLPFEIRTAEVVAWLSRRGREVICHLPMEPGGGADPGPGALTSAMTPAELEAGVEAALNAVPTATGVNNHMGSRLSAQEGSMRAILGVLSERDLFFLDSRTSARSVGYTLARDLGLPAAERQVFLDRDPATAAIDEQFDRLLALARERGAAIAIGHPYPETYEVLARRVPEAVAAGYELVPVSFLLDASGEPIG